MHIFKHTFNAFITVITGVGLCFVPIRIQQRTISGCRAEGMTCCVAASVDDYREGVSTVENTGCDCCTKATHHLPSGRKSPTIHRTDEQRINHLPPQPLSFSRAVVMKTVALPTLFDDFPHVPPHIGSTVLRI